MTIQMNDSTHATHTNNTSISDSRAEFAKSNSCKQEQNMNKNLPLVVTSGEPAGIGMDIILQLAEQGKFDELDRQVIILADEEALKQRVNQIYGSEASKHLINSWLRIAEASEFDEFDELESSSKVGDLLNISINNAKQGLSKDVKEIRFLLIHVPCQTEVVSSQLDIANATMVINQLELAHKLANHGLASAIVTGPLQKSILIDAGLTLDDGSMFTGHTEFFMQKSGCDKVVMMLANSVMKVALVTIHMALRDVADAITSQNVRQTVQIVLDDLKSKFGLSNPKVLVCGLNPHAGEGGHLGTEENEIINPVLLEFQNKGFDISSAMPADTLFTTRHLNNCDAVIAMYHDQGLPVLKSHGFGDTVNLTLGLPYIRTSVDHGTALDLAGRKEGEGQASSSSLWQALKMADDMATSQANLS